MPAVSRESVAVIERRIGDIDAILCGSGREEARGFFRGLTVDFVLKLPRLSDREAEALEEAYVDELSTLPAWALAGARSTLRREANFFPSIAEIFEAAGREMRAVRIERNKLRTLLLKASE